MNEIHLLGTKYGVFEDQSEYRSLLEVPRINFRVDFQLTLYLLRLSSNRPINGFFTRRNRFPISRTFCNHKDRKIPIIEIPYDNPALTCRTITDYIADTIEGLWLYFGKKTSCEELEKRLKETDSKIAIADLELWFAGHS